MFIRIFDGIYNFDEVSGVTRDGKNLNIHMKTEKGWKITCDDEEHALSLLDFVSSRIVLPGNDFVENCRLATKVVEENTND